MKALLLTISCVILLTKISVASPPEFTFNVTQIAHPHGPLDTSYTKIYHFYLADTNNVAKLHVKMGTTSGGTEIFQEEIDYDPAGPLPYGFGYIRTGNHIELTVGITSFGFYYYEAQLENASAELSDAETKDSWVHLNP